MNQLFKEIDHLQQKYNEKRPLPHETLNSMREDLIMKWTYHSNSIEGSTLTLSETKVVLEDGITIGGKSMKEHLEAINHKEAILYLEDVVQRKEMLTARTMKDFHSIILRGIDQEYAGVYRNKNVLIAGAEHIPPDALKVQEKMDELFVWYRNEAQHFHPVKRATLLHSYFVKIYPFIDGNGRTARLLLNLELMMSGYVPIVIKNDQRADYYQILDKAHTTGDNSDFIMFVGNILQDTLEFYLSFLGE
ncbi:Fic family protein [Virgibacillus sp. NKC19-3]|uniref:Fic family protein n=1 Tax=Virgibacillus saliphilus TaxID=2831674 RepID=UPI001C9BA86C|nr:Fic family protein [Virgibacillus sp. NKC19-3]MBY7142135.1 Fic family protein [Virgibacillus sp. NKC19-3]